MLGRLSGQSMWTSKQKGCCEQKLNLRTHIKPFVLSEKSRTQEIEVNVEEDEEEKEEAEYDKTESPIGL